MESRSSSYFSFVLESRFDRLLNVFAILRKIVAFSSVGFVSTGSIRRFELVHSRFPLPVLEIMRNGVKTNAAVCLLCAIFHTRYRFCRCFGKIKPTFVSHAPSTGKNENETMGVKSTSSGANSSPSTKKKKKKKKTNKNEIYWEIWSREWIFKEPFKSLTSAVNQWLISLLNGSESTFGGGCLRVQ